ncbi:MAG: hypothetical protein Q9183_003036, partial [Haloplaca sp. 2 TL-2023]
MQLSHSVLLALVASATALPTPQWSWPSWPSWPPSTGGGSTGGGSTGGGSTGGGSTGGGSTGGGSTGGWGGFGGSSSSTANDVTNKASCKALTVIFARGTGESGNIGSVIGPRLLTALESRVGADK